MQVQGLTKTFGTHLALRGVDLEIKKGESAIIFGPNGAGKTTLIKVLSTIMSPTSGKVLVEGLDLRDNAEEIRRRVGVVSHQTFLYGNLTGQENLEFYCRMYDVPDRRKRIREVAGMLRMTSRLHDRVATLSRGMQQRLSIARSLLHQPSIMLLDEPETGLDQQSTALFWEALRTEGKEKRTIIMVTHSLERGLELGDRFFVIAGGKVVYEGACQGLGLSDLKEAYQRCTVGRGA